VNSPWRTNRLMLRIKENYANVSMSVVGSQWGLACNMYHFLDLFLWLSNAEDAVHFNLCNTLLQAGVQSSKRSSYFEVFGAVTGKLETGSSSVFLSCNSEGSLPLKVILHNSSFSCEYTPVSGLLSMHVVGCEFCNKFRIYP